MTVLHPAYFPNVAFFSVFEKADKVVWEYEDNYQKQTFRNRTHICTDRGKHMLSIPIVHTKGEHGRQAYKEVKIDNSNPWQRQHWRTLETAYRTSPYFEFYEDDLKPLFERTHELLIHLNLDTINTLCDILQLEMPKQRTEKYSAVHTNDYRFLVNAKKDLEQNFSPYVQVFGERHGFLPNLSLLDVLFNLGPNSLTYVRQWDSKGLHA